MDKFAKKFAEALSESFLLSDRDVRIDGGITYLPLYMAPLLVRPQQPQDRVRQVGRARR